MTDRDPTTCAVGWVRSAKGWQTSRVRSRVLAALLLVAVTTLAACSDDPDPVPAPDPSATTEAPTYDPSQEPAAAVLVLVPDEATRLAVTDLEQIRLRLGKPTLTSESPQRERDAFWRQLEARTAVLTAGVLRPVEDRLSEEYGFTQDDVEWEAQFGGGAAGYLLKLGEDVDMASVRRAVEDGVGPLEGATVATEERVVGINFARSAEESWAADPAVRELVGSVSGSTYVQRECLPFDTVYGEGVREQLAETPAADVAGLEELGPFSISFGSELATVLLGPAREDAFARARLGEHLPATVPEFGSAFRDPVADPAGGRIGYTIGDQTAAAELTLAQRLPFALCAD